MMMSILPMSIFAQGSLTPPGAPGLTMKSLDQIEARTPISSAPFTISASGSYYLTKNLNVSSGDALAINASGVTLDLNGFTISSTASTPNGTAILITSSRNITIKNGFIQSGVTRTGTTFSGTGFVNGIYFAGFIDNVLISQVSVRGVLGEGIDLGTSDSTIVEACNARLVGGGGIVASHIHNSAVREGGNIGIYGSQVENSSAVCIGSFTALQAIDALNCFGYTNGSGTGIDAVTASNCYGLSTSGSGLKAQVALNSRGVGAGFGLQATATATNCYGETSDASLTIGLDAGTATGCYGKAAGGIGLQAKTAVNSYGESTGYFGILANLVINCRGVTTNGSYGLGFVELAANCIGIKQSNSTSGVVLGGGQAGAGHLP